MKFKNFSFSKLFSNTRFSMFFAIFAAFFFWLAITIDQTDIITKNFEVNVNTLETPAWLSDELGLDYVSVREESVIVTAKGPNSTVNSLDNDDLRIAGDFSPVNGSGVYTIDLYVSNAGEHSGVSFEIMPKSVSVKIDKNETLSFPVTAVAQDVTLDKDVGNDYRLSEPTFVQDKFNSIEVSGPVTELEKIHSVKAVVDNREAIKKASSYTAKLKFYDKDGKEITDTSLYTYSEEEIKVNIFVYAKKKVKLVPVIEGNISVPAGKSIVPNLSMNSINVYGSPEIIEKLQDIKLQTIVLSDESGINKEHIVKLILPSGVHIDESIHGSDEISVKVTITIQ